MVFPDDVTGPIRAALGTVSCPNCLICHIFTGRFERGPCLARTRHEVHGHQSRLKSMPSPPIRQCRGPSYREDVMTLRRPASSIWPERTSPPRCVPPRPHAPLSTPDQDSARRAAMSERDWLSSPTNASVGHAASRIPTPRARPCAQTLNPLLSSLANIAATNVVSAASVDDAEHCAVID